MNSARKRSGYAAKRDAAAVPHRYSALYYTWHAAAKAGRETAEHHADWCARYGPCWVPERKAA